MSQLETQLDQVLETLVHDVVASVHAMYRGEFRQETAKLKTSEQCNTARQALLNLVGVPQPAPNGTEPAPVRASTLSPDEVAAVTRCITGWLPMGDPRTVTPEMRCIPGAREIMPTWGEREKARLAMRRAATS